MRFLPENMTEDFFGWIDSKLLISFIKLICLGSKLTATSYLFFLMSLKRVFLLISVDLRTLIVYLSQSFINVSVLVLIFFSKASICCLHYFPSGWSAQLSIRIWFSRYWYFSSLCLICLAQMTEPALEGMSLTLQILIFSVSTYELRNLASNKLIPFLTVLSNWLWYSSMALFILGLKKSPLNLEKILNI